MTRSPDPVVLIVRDGWGRNPHPDHARFDAIRLAATPVADRLEHDWPTTLVRTCGEDVGLPEGTMGNSEVGHQNIGAGRIVNQSIMRITSAIRDGSFFTNAQLTGAFEYARSSGGRVHLLGLVSDGKVHSDLEHLLALIDLAAQEQFPGDRLVVHAITDGRDTAPRGGLGFVERVEAHLARRGVGRIGSVIGRFYAMDRDHRWERVSEAYRCLTGRSTGSDAASGPPRFESAEAAIRRAYGTPDDPNRPGDEFITPAQIVRDGESPAVIGDGDAVIFFNFRGDRPRELTRAFVSDDEAWPAVQGGGFERGARVRDLRFVTMTGYEEGLPVEVAFARPPKLPDILGQVVADAGLEQFRCAETEKFPHVTFFFNDYREPPFPGENRLLVPSPRDVLTYDRKPEMSAEGVCQGVLDRLDAPDAEPLMVVNFANGDMVGHTGVLDATIRAVEVVDACVGRIVDATLRRGGSLVVTADHGNAEQMWDPVHDTAHTAHTTYDVPLIVLGETWRGTTLRSGGRLADIAPTVLTMMGLPVPAAMTGESLLDPA